MTRTRTDEIVTIQIGANQRSLNNVDESWINQQINDRRSDGQPVCVRVTIRSSGLNMVLSTPNCVSSGGSSRLPNAQEKRIFDLWDLRGLNKDNFTGGNLIAFLKQIKQII